MAAFSNFSVRNWGKIEKSLFLAIFYKPTVQTLTCGG
jgi:hypothetical protein